jgi:hypothetical protein
LETFFCLFLHNSVSLKRKEWKVLALYTASILDISACLWSFQVTIQLNDLSNHLGDQNLVVVKNGWPFSTDCVNRECAAQGQKHSGRITKIRTDLRLSSWFVHGVLTV